MIPDETTYAIVNIPRWQRNWLKEHKTINRSGYFQKCLNLLIAAQDPEYFEQYKDYALKPIKRTETTPDPEKLFKIEPKHIVANI